MSVFVQAFPSLHAVPLVLFGFERNPRRGITRTGVVALVLGRAGDQVRTRATPGHARVCLRAGIAVVAPGAVGLWCRRRADARRRIAGPDFVTLASYGPTTGIPPWHAPPDTNRSGCTCSHRRKGRHSRRSRPCPCTPAHPPGTTECRRGRAVPAARRLTPRRRRRNCHLCKPCLFRTSLRRA